MTSALSCAQSETQGPCSLAQFRGWVRNLRADARFKAQLEEFSNVSVWKARPPTPATSPYAVLEDLLCRLLSAQIG